MESVGGPLLSKVDSGARFFCGGKMYFRQIDQLTVNVSTARTIDDKDWVAFLEETLALSRHMGVVTRVSMICSVHSYPNARQRMAASEFLIRNRLEKVGRVAVVTDSVMVRGAVTAFSWMMPKLRLNAFHSGDVPAAFQWLHEQATFDEAHALHAWEEAQFRLGMKPGTSIRPTPVG